MGYFAGVCFVPFSDTGVDLLVINNQKDVMTALSGKRTSAVHNARSQLCPSETYSCFPDFDLYD